MNESDVIRLRHMRDAAKTARAIATGKKRDDLDSDEMLKLSLVKCIEIIGEAASKISAAGEKECPNIPWADIIGMRNRLIHTYFDINLNILWKTVSEELQPLIDELEQLLPPGREKNESQ
ncbi:MAG: DUF86 domain-containing protein [Chloroflexi bacterium]|nr:DUF86 domain-containing protein [Chloroflexota bacterium]